jgi:hypothetical protein
MSDSIEKLREWVAEVELHHQEGESECVYCSNGSTTPFDRPWPCDAARGAAVVKAMLDVASRSVVPSPVQRAFSMVLDAGASALEGK